MEEDTKKRVDYTPITQGLRGRLKVAALGLAKPMVDGLMAECDNIDAIHKALEDEYADMRTFADRLSDAADKREDVDLWDTNRQAPTACGGGRMTHTDDVPTLHEIVDLAEDFNTAMESDDRAAAKLFFALMEHSTIELHTYLVALDLVRDYWGQLANGGDV